MIKPDRVIYLKKIFTSEVQYYREQVLLGEQELSIAEQSLKKRKEDLLESRLKLRLATEELEKLHYES